MRSFASFPPSIFPTACAFSITHIMSTIFRQPPQAKIERQFVSRGSQSRRQMAVSRPQRHLVASATPASRLWGDSVANLVDGVNHLLRKLVLLRSLLCDGESTIRHSRILACRSVSLLFIWTCPCVRDLKSSLRTRRHSPRARKLSACARGRSSVCWGELSPPVAWRLST